MSSIFTKIITREISSEIVHETERVIVILDIHPIRPGHMLVIPKKEVDEFQDLDRDTYLEVMDVAYDMAHLLKERLNPPRVGVIIEGFDVPHAHVHVTPLHDRRDVVSTTRSKNFHQEKPDFAALTEMRKRLASNG